jgi:hypothetical protein
MRLQLHFTLFVRPRGSSSDLGGVKNVQGVVLISTSLSSLVLGMGKESRRNRLGFYFALAVNLGTRFHQVKVKTTVARKGGLKSECLHSLSVGDSDVSML